eukprot:TRINITY_DN1408_c0_g1_i3.p1 TRINITY_DN1408_c0_g1~~TRINITY_DN1408_c0_g1_i3.p1  ORF type:complete len:136 (+),score=4.61 TRINITY_DN1408_c0_g1_i3:127-534(+)
MTSTSIPSTNPRSAGTYSEYSGYQVIDPRTGYPNYLGFPSNPIYVPPGAGTTGSYYPPSSYQTIPSTYQTVPSSSGSVSGTGSVTTSMNSASFVSTTVSPISTTTTKSTSTTTTTTTPYFQSRPMSDFYYSAAYR